MESHSQSECAHLGLARILICRFWYPHKTATYLSVSIKWHHWGHQQCPGVLMLVGFSPWNWYTIDKLVRLLSLWHFVPIPENISIRECCVFLNSQCTKWSRDCFSLSQSASVGSPSAAVMRQIRFPFHWQHYFQRDSCFLLFCYFSFPQRRMIILILIFFCAK